MFFDDNNDYDDDDNNNDDNDDDDDDDDGDDDDDEQVLHLWWECLCLAHSALESWYLPHSLMTSPGWILVKCELR